MYAKLNFIISPPFVSKLESFYIYNIYFLIQKVNASTCYFRDFSLSKTEILYNLTIIRIRGCHNDYRG